MNNLDLDTILSESLEEERQMAGANSPKSSFDKEEWAEKKQTERKLVYGLLEQATESIGIDGENLKVYLDVQSRFFPYSVSNALLITNQMPEATHVKDFASWKEANQYIKKDSQGIFILGPGKEYTKKDGTNGMSHNPKKVYDVSQLSKSPILPEESNQTIPHDERSLLKSLIFRAPVVIKTVDELSIPTQIALYDAGSEILSVKKGIGAQDLFRALTVELAHAEYAQIHTDSDKGTEPYSRQKYGFKAYCASYMLCKQYGVEASNYQFRNAPEQFAQMTPQEIRANLGQIRDVTNQISTRIYRNLEQAKQSKAKDEQIR